LGVSSISDLTGTLGSSKKPRAQITSETLGDILSKMYNAYMKIAVSTTVAQMPLSELSSSTGTSFDYHMKLFHKIIVVHGDELGLSSKTLDWALSQQCPEHAANKETVKKWVKTIPLKFVKTVDAQR
jgi:hypothetical protein